MARQQGWFALILALAIAAGAVLASFPLQLGLDLRGRQPAHPAGAAGRCDQDRAAGAARGRQGGARPPRQRPRGGRIHPADHR